MVALYIVPQSCSFNLAADSAVTLQGPSNASFGYSVALWRRKAPGASPLVVGSPLAPAPDGVLGLIFFCSPSTGECEADRRPLRGGDETVLASIPSWIRSDMGYGETLTTAPNSPYLLACAPRYPFHLTTPSERRGILSRGGCRLLGPKGPENLVPVTDAIIVIRKGDGSEKWHYNSIWYTGFSTCGFSCAMGQSGESIFLGAPMAYNGEGTVYWRSAVKQPLQSPEQRTSRNEALISMNEFWAVLLARLDGASDVLAASAPNAQNMIGEVHLYSVRDGKLELRRPRGGVLLQGKEMTSMYGYALAGGDFDGDGVDDLAVGAPFATGAGGDAGTVHITYGPLVKSVERGGLLLSGARAGGHYGLSLQGAGDLDGDGCADLAVGAPDDGAGRVFIYNGSPEGIRPQPSQVLRGESFLPGVQRGRFGFSLAAAHDIDANGCPDVLVGAVAASRAVFIRSAPVLSLVGSLQFDPSVVVLGQTTCSVRTGTEAANSYTCFHLVVDLRYNSTVYNQTISTRVRASVDDRYPFVRTLFLATHNKIFETQHGVNHVSSPEISPLRLQVYLKSERPSLSELIWASINVTLETDLTSVPRPASRGQSVLPVVPPVLQNVLFENTSRLACKDVHECYAPSDLTLKVHHSSLIIGGGRQSVAVNITVSEARAYQVVLEVLLPSLLSFSHITANQGAPHCSHASATAAQLFLTLTCTVENTLSIGAEVQLTLHLLHSPLLLLAAVRSEAAMDLRLQLSVKSDTEDLRPQDNKGTLLLEPIIKNEIHFGGSSRPEQVRAMVNTSLELPALLQLSPHNNSERVTVLGPAVSHTYTISNRGPTPVVDEEILLEWPLYTSLGGGQLPVLYITEELTISGPVNCTRPPVNPLNFSQAQEDDALQGWGYQEDEDDVQNSFNITGPVRARRSPTKVITGDEGHGEGTVTTVPAINCHLLACYTIKCSVSALMAGEVVQVTVHSRLTVAMLDKKHRHLTVSSRARLQSSGESATVSTRVTLLQPLKTALGLLSGKLWLVCIALLVGLLLLLLLAIGLYKCGFFRREKRQRLQQLRASQRRSRHDPMALTKEEEQERQQLYVQEQLEHMGQKHQQENKHPPEQGPLFEQEQFPYDQEQLPYDQAPELGPLELHVDDPSQIYPEDQLQLAGQSIAPNA